MCWGRSSCLLGPGRCPEWVVLASGMWGLEGVPQARRGSECRVSALTALGTTSGSCLRGVLRAREAAGGIW